MEDQPRDRNGRFGTTGLSETADDVTLGAINDETAGSKKHLVAGRDQLTGEEMRMLLDDLDTRLRVRGVAASVYIVGGAALALTGSRDQQTPDIDAVTNSDAVWDEARQMAEEYGLPASWMNDRARPFIPPQDPETLIDPVDPGLTEHVAPPRHLLAMKMVAFRPKDLPDLERLVVELDMEDARPEDFADLLIEVYSGEDRLADALGTPGADPDGARTEALALGRHMVRIADAVKKRRTAEPGQ